MKDKWKSFFSFLGIKENDVQTSADGVFMKEEDVDKLKSIQDSNITLTAAVASEKELRIAAEDALNAATEKHSNELIAKDGEITRLTEQHATEIKAAGDREAALQAELDKIKGVSTHVSTVGKIDPIGTGKRKLTANELAAEKNAAALRGESFDSEDDEDEAAAEETQTV